MKKLKVLVCMLSLVSLAVLTACDDDDDDNGGGGNPPVGSNTVAGRTMTVNVTDSSGPFPPAGTTYTIAFTDTDYSYTEGTNQFSGTYTFSRSGTTGTLVTDGSLTSILTFATETTGTVRTDDGGDFEQGNFTLTP